MTDSRTPKARITTKEVPVRVNLPAGGPVVVHVPLSGGRTARIELSADRRTLDVVLAEAAPPPSLEGLSPREREVAFFVARGLGNREVARELGLGEATVASHLVSVYKKLRLFGRYELARLVMDGERPTRISKRRARAS